MKLLITMSSHGHVRWWRRCNSEIGESSAILDAEWVVGRSASAVWARRLVGPLTGDVSSIRRRSTHTVPHWVDHEGCTASDCPWRNKRCDIAAAVAVPSVSTVPGGISRHRGQRRGPSAIMSA